MSSWLYQVRIKVSLELSENFRANVSSVTAKKTIFIEYNFGMKIVCIFDGFDDYYKGAEKEGIENYLLYNWTKSVILDPKNVEKNQKTFAFYQRVKQVYSKKIAKHFVDVISVTLIDSNPANNPQPLIKNCYVKTFCFPII